MKTFQNLECHVGCRAFDPFVNIGRDSDSWNVAAQLSRHGMTWLGLNARVADLMRWWSLVKTHDSFVLLAFSHRKAKQDWNDPMRKFEEEQAPTGFWISYCNGKRSASNLLARKTRVQVGKKCNHRSPHICNMLLGGRTEILLTCWKIEREHVIATADTLGWQSPPFMEVKQVCQMWGRSFSWPTVRLE